MTVVVRIQSRKLIEKALNGAAAKIERSVRKSVLAAAVDIEQAKARREKFERLLLSQISLAGLPPPQTQLQYIPGRKFTADMAWRDYRLIVEVQGGIWRRGGGAHSHPNNILRDIEKAQLSILCGWVIFPVTTDEVVKRRAVQLVEFALRARGYKT